MKIIVISDLRVHLILTALAVYKQQKKDYNVQLVISERVLTNNDYGHFFPVWYKKIKFFILKYLCNVRVVKSSSSTTIDNADSLGIISSLCSITTDSMADEAKYPELYFNLKNLVKGAKEITDYIKKNNVDEVFLFNGRTSSSEFIVRYCFLHKLKTSYYEYGSKFGKNYLLMDFPIHNAYKYGLALTEFYNNNLINKNEIVEKGKVFSARKINNSYTKNYILESEKTYDVTIFLCSDHEYTNVNPDIIGIEPLGNYKLCKHVLDKYGVDLKYAVRAHPNQRQDPSYEKSMAPIIEFCKEFNIDFYGPESSISSYSLIEKSKLVTVELSSIGVDAVILGKEVDVFGKNDLKAILDTVPEHIKNNKKLLSIYVSEVLSLYEYLYQYDFNRKFKIWNKFLYRIEHEIVKRVDLKKYIK